MAQNSKIIAYTSTLGKAARTLLAGRQDVTAIEFPNPTVGEPWREVLKANPRVNAVILGGQQISGHEVALAQSLEVVARVGVGYDMIDIPALEPRRIPLMTAGIANSPSVAEQTFHMLFTLIKRGREQDKLVREGRWHSQRMVEMPNDIFGKTMVVIGFGRIGTRVVKRALAMEMDVLVFDPFVAPEAIEKAGAVPVAHLDDALPHADVLTIHCPRTLESMGLIDARRLALLKPTAVLINTARGGLVDEPALGTALKAGRLAGAGLDVLEREPPPADHPLFAAPNVIFAAHMAGVTVEAVERMSIAAVENVLSVFDGAIREQNVVNWQVLHQAKS